MIRYSLLRRPDRGAFRRYSSNDRAAARSAALQNLPDTLSMAAKSAMSDPAGIRAFQEVMFELESNRLQRPVTPRLLYNGVSVGVADPSMVLASIASGRRNPTALYWILDATPIDLSMIFDSTDPDAELPVRWASATTRSTVNNGTMAVTGNPLLQWNENLTSASTIALATSTSTGDAGRLSDPDASGEGNVGWCAPTRAGVIAPALGVPCKYRVGPDGLRTFTISVAVRCSGGPAQIRLELVTNDGTTDRTASAWIEHIAPTVGQGPMYRLSREVEVEAPAGTTFTSIYPKIWYEAGSTATRLEIDDVQVYAGQPRSADQGRNAVVPVQDTIAELTWTGQARRINRVEVDGDQHLGQITSAAVYVQLTAGGAWTYLNSNGAPGRLAIDFDPVDAWGVRVLVEESGAGVGGGVWINELDPMLMVDATDDVESLEATWTREADPGTSSSPVGTFEASELSLTLDDTQSRWNPGLNASLDVGHRIEVAAGIRYTNLMSNPRADVDASTWEAGVVRVTDDLPAGAPLSTGFKLPAAVGATETREGESLFTLPNDWHRISGWVRVEGEAATGYLTMVAALSDGTIVDELTPVVVTEDMGWVYIQNEQQATVSGAFFYQPRLSVTAGAGTPAAIYSTRQALEFLPDGPTGDPLTHEEIVSVGVYYSQPYETDSASSTVTIPAVDRLGRLSDATVDEVVRVGQTVDRIVSELALQYLDLDSDQVQVTPTVGSLILPYCAPAGNLGSYLADLAKATATTLHMDSLNRLMMSARTDTTDDAVAEIRADNALVSHRRSPGVDVTTSIVTVNGAPLLKADDPVSLWSVPSGGLTIPVGQSREIIGQYSTTPAVDAAIGPITADGAYTVLSEQYFSDRAIIKIRNDAAVPLVVAFFEILGYPLVEGILTARAIHQPSVDRYGPRELKVDVRLVQTQDQVDVIAAVLLDAFRAIDNDGVRRLPDLVANSLGLFHLEAGDKVTAVNKAGGLGGDYTLLGRSLQYSAGALVLNGVKLREAFDGKLFILDVTPIDDVYVLGY